MESESLGFCFSTRMAIWWQFVVFFIHYTCKAIFFISFFLNCKTVHVQKHRCVFHMQYTSHLHQIYTCNLFKTPRYLFRPSFCQNKLEATKRNVNLKKTPSNSEGKNNITKKSYSISKIHIKVPSSINRLEKTNLPTPSSWRSKNIFF